MFCKQILSFKRNHKHKSSIGKCQKNMADNKLISLTLKVENASEATSKVGNSTNLKNNSKLADSKMYLKNHYKFNCMKRWNIKGHIHFSARKKHIKTADSIMEILLLWQSGVFINFWWDLSISVLKAWPLIPPTTCSSLRCMSGSFHI